MNGYVDQLMTLKDIEFVTLTVKNCSGNDLDALVDKILKEIVLIIRNLREKKGIKVSGIRKLEILYNSLTNEYHPHLHLLVDKGCGNLIVDQWLKRMPNTNVKGQDFRKADTNSLSELFKYTTKIVTSKKGKIFVYIKPLNRILECLYKRRCFQPFGIIRNVSEDVDELDGKVYSELEDSEGAIIEWVWDDCDWVNNRKTLTGYIPPPDIEITIIN
jgi:hypothetical protein